MGLLNLPPEVRSEIWRHVFQGGRYDIWYAEPSYQTACTYRTSALKTCAQIMNRLKPGHVVVPEKDLCAKWKKCTVYTCALAHSRELLLPGLCRTLHDEILYAAFAYSIFDVMGSAYGRFLGSLTHQQRQSIRTIRTQMQAWLTNGEFSYWGTPSWSGPSLTQAFRTVEFPPKARLEIWISLCNRNPQGLWRHGSNQPESYYRGLLKQAMAQLPLLKGQPVAGFNTETTASGLVTMGYDADLNEVAQPKSSQ